MKVVRVFPPWKGFPIYYCPKMLVHPGAVNWARVITGDAKPIPGLVALTEFEESLK